jgi:capsule polysaccharide export protein KpsE/RkpR
VTILEILSALKNKIKKRLPISLIIALIVAVVVGLYIRQEPREYIATAKIFPLSANSAMGSSSPLSQLKSQFGIKADAGGEIYDIKELINSKRLSFKVSSSKPLNKKYNKFYEWLIADHNSELGWREKEITISDKRKDSLSNIIKGRSIMLGRVEVDKSENGYTSLRVKAYEKELAKEINETILIALSEFYIEFVTQKPRSDLRTIQAMRDSLSTELSAVTKAIAGRQDKSAYAVKAYVGLPQIKLKRKQAEIQSVYSTTVNALQNARFKLLSESPIFQVLDYPGEPYNSEKPDWKLPAIAAFILTFILLSLWFCRKIFGKVIIEELKKA